MSNKTFCSCIPFSSLKYNKDSVVLKFIPTLTYSNISISIIIKITNNYIPCSLNFKGFHCGHFKFFSPYRTIAFSSSHSGEKEIPNHLCHLHQYHLKQKCLLSQKSFSFQTYSSLSSPFRKATSFWNIEDKSYYQS